MLSMKLLMVFALNHPDLCRTTAECGIWYHATMMEEMAVTPEECEGAKFALDIAEEVSNRIDAEDPYLEEHPEH